MTAQDLRREIESCREEFRAFEDYLFHNMAPEKERNRVLSCEVQRSATWCSRREDLITASTFGVIAEQSEFSTCFSYWEHRMGLDNHHILDAEEEMVNRNHVEHARRRHLRRGTTLESLAIRSYVLQFHDSLEPNLHVEQTGLWTLWDQGRAFLGASPDGLLRDSDGCLEVKCPERGPAARVSPEHMCQIQGQLKICHRSFCDYVSFHPVEGFSVFRVHRSEEFWSWLYPFLQEFYCCLMSGDQPPPRRFERAPQSMTPPAVRVEKLGWFPNNLF